MICVSLGNIALTDALKICCEVPLVEIRADLLKWDHDSYAAIIRSGVKTIFTCRPGVFPEEERKELFSFAGKSGVSYMDVEYEADIAFIEHALKIRETCSAEMIISYHNYQATPHREELETILTECYKKGADVAKIACLADSHAEAAKLLSLYALPGRKVILGMGTKAKITRIAALYLGSEFTFASAGTGTETAAGQIDYKTMKEISGLINI